MLDEFIASNREAIIERARARVASRTLPTPTPVELTNGIPVFLEQLGEALRLVRATGEVDHEEIETTGARHGSDLLRLGLTIRQVVHDYGDICQVVTEMAIETGAPISPEEFRMLNLCLDNAIAAAVSEYSRQREKVITAEGTERLGVLTHEMRNRLNTAMLASESIASGRVAAGGSTSLVLRRSLIGLRDLIDRSLVDVRLEAGIERMEPLSVADLVAELEIGAALQASVRGLHFTSTNVPPAVTVEGDRQLLIGALSNLIQNAFKFTRKNGSVLLKMEATSDRVLFHVEDECGGLPPGTIEGLFQPFSQRSADRSGVGLGLSISLKAAKVNGGEIRVQNCPGKGCIFTLDLPRAPTPPLTIVGRKTDAA